MPIRIAIYVQHLLGTGHTVRMMALADELSARSHSVLLVCGGVMTVGAGDHKPYELFQLPAVKASAGSFSTLLDRSGDEVDDEWKENRAALLRKKISAFSPDVLVVETFPFGRRQMRFELLPLLRLVQNMPTAPLVLCSIRDILQERKPKRNRETLELLDRFFHGVMVHGDPKLVALSDSFPCESQIVPPVFYTGYISKVSSLKNVSPKENPSKRKKIDKDGVNEVIVSAGGGAVGQALLKAAIDAKPLSSLNDCVWRILVGGNLETKYVDELKRQSNGQIIVEKNRIDFPLLLTRCTLSISQAGYNSCLDIIHAKVKSVLVPFCGDGETEQYQRAQLMENKGLAVVLHELDLNAQSLADAVDVAMGLSVGSFELNTQGASGAAKVIESRLDERKT